MAEQITRDHSHRVSLNLNHCFSNWRGKVLFLAIDPDVKENYPEMEEVYKIAAEAHNKNIETLYPDAGFDLFSPKEVVRRSTRPEISTIKIDFGVKCAMFKEMFVSNQDTESLELCLNNPVGYYMYNRSSNSKKSFRLANSVGIIDSGYRGNLMGYFDINTNYGTSNREEGYACILNKGDRIIQLCSGSLEPFKVAVVENIEIFGSTERGEGGFGSTGI